MDSPAAPLPPIAFLGAGQMAEAFVRGLLRAELLQPSSVWVSDVRALLMDAIVAATDADSSPGPR